MQPFSFFVLHGDWAHLIFTWSFSAGSVVKKPPANARDTGYKGSTPGLWRPPGGGKSPFLYSCLENSTDRGVWQATLHSVDSLWGPKESAMTEHAYNNAKTTEFIWFSVNKHSPTTICTDYMICGKGIMR